MNKKRIIIGLISLALLLIGLITYLTAGYTDTNAFILGMCVRLGIVMMMFYLAWPTIEHLADRMPLFANGVCLAGIAFFVIRPRLLPLILGLVLLTLTVHFGLRFAANRMK